MREKSDLSYPGQEEHSPQQLEDGQDSQSDLSIQLRNSSFSWTVRDKDSKAVRDVPALTDLSLDVTRGQLVGIAGGVGAGKSSLVSAILGEMRERGGSSRVRGRLGYVAQQSWIFSGTVRDNIILGSRYEAEWFSKVVEVCALTRDFKLLEHGDLTEVGERGITLSGGQKQRISLARALYSRADIFLLDDPLSAVDAKVGQFIFRRCIKEAMKDKTVLLVSHGLQYLKECDTVIFLKDGKMVEAGKPEELLSRSQGHLAGLAQFDYPGDKVQVKDRDGREELVDHQYEEEEEVQSVEGEEPRRDNRGWAALFRYLRQCGSRLELAVIFVFVVIFVLDRLFTTVFLQIWLDAGDGLEEVRRQNESYSNLTDHDFRGFVIYNPDLWKYQLGYGMIVLGMLLSGFVKGTALLFKLLRGSRKVHHKMVEGITKSPMAFFDVTPSGWILTRFSRDMDVSKFILNPKHADKLQRI